MKRTTLRAPGKRPDDLNQSRAFIEKAGEIGAAEDSSRAGELLSALAKMPPEPSKRRRASKG